MAKGPMDIALTIHFGVDKEGRVTLDWEAEVTVPKNVEPPRIDQYMAKGIMEAATAAMDVKDSLNWRVREPKPVDAKPEDPDQLP